jgi:hypothetical protein
LGPWSLIGWGGPWGPRLHDELVAREDAFGGGERARLRHIGDVELEAGDVEARLDRAIAEPDDFPDFGVGFPPASPQQDFALALGERVSSRGIVHHAPVG